MPENRARYKDLLKVLFLGSVILGSMWGTELGTQQRIESQYKDVLSSWPLLQVTGCLIQLKSPEEDYVTHFRILCWKMERGFFIHGLPSPTGQRFTTGCLISQTSFWVLVNTKTSTKKPLGGRRDVRKA